VLDSRGATASIPIEDVRLTLCADLERGVCKDAEQALCQNRLSPRRRVIAKQAILDQLLCDARVSGCWTLHPSSKQNLWDKLKHTGFPKLLTWMVVSQLLVSVLFLASWWLLGSMMLAGCRQVRTQLDDRLGTGPYYHDSAADCQSAYRRMDCTSGRHVA